MIVMGTTRVEEEDEALLETVFIIINIIIVIKITSDEVKEKLKKKS